MDRLSRKRKSASEFPTQEEPFTPDYGSLSDLRQALENQSWTNQRLGECLRQAARNDDPAALTLLLDAGADVNAQDPEGWCALKVAALVDGESSIRLLAARGGKPDLCDHRGRTALMEASWQHNARAVRALLEAGASPDLQEPEWGPAIADTDCCDCVQHLVEAGARIDVQRRRYRSVPTLLELAAQKGRLDLMKQLVERGARPSASSLAWSARRGEVMALLWQVSQGADPRGSNALGETPLMGAAEQRAFTGHSGLATSQLLLQHGADATALNCVGHAAVHKSVMADDAECVEFLFQYPLPDQAEPVLHLAARLNRTSCLAAILRAGSDRLNLLWNGCTPLMVAAAAGSLEAARDLLEAGADLEATDPEGATALFHAVFYAQTEVLRLLVKAGARLNAVDHQGRTALMRAAEGIHNATMVPCLLALGADPRCQDLKGADAALYACLSHQQDGQALRAILKGLGHPKRASQLQLPFAQAALTGRVWPGLTRSRASVLRVLLEFGADPSEPHLVAYAQASQDQEIIQLLRRHGIDVTQRTVDIQPNWDWDH